MLFIDSLESFRHVVFQSVFDLVATLLCEIGNFVYLHQLVRRNAIGDSETIANLMLAYPQEGNLEFALDMLVSLGKDTQAVDLMMKMNRVCIDNLAC